MDTKQPERFTPKNTDARRTVNSQFQNGHDAKAHHSPEGANRIGCSRGAGHDCLLAKKRCRLPTIAGQITARFFPKLPLPFKKASPRKNPCHGHL